MINSKDPFSSSSSSSSFSSSPSSLFEEEYEKIFLMSEKAFKKGHYLEAENFLNQLVIKNYKKPHAFHMLGTIYYDQGKFNKALRAFKRALDIDPTFTDASLGLSILLNDLGRYKEGEKVFQEAERLLKSHSEDKDQVINQSLSSKHKELGELYFQNEKYDEALTQYFKALSLAPSNLYLHLSIVDCFLLLGREEEAFYELKDLCKEHPSFYPARLKIGKIYYEKGELDKAAFEWKEVLRQNPDNLQAKIYLESSKQSAQPSFSSPSF